MEIAWFTETWLPTRDGVVTSLLLFKEILEKRGYNIYIFAPGKENKEEDNIIYYKMRTFKKYPNYRFLPSFPTFVNSFSRTKNIIKKIEPYIIHSHSPGFIGINAFVASKNTPLIFTFHTFFDESAYFLFKNECMQKMAIKAAYSWMKFYFKKCNVIIAPSQYAAKRIERIAGKKAVVLPTGIDIKKFERGNGKLIREKFHGKKIILHVGRIVKEKNIDLLIKAAPYILKKIDAVFIIVGDGPEKKKLMRKAQEMGLEKEFIFTGFIPDEELPNYYKAADVFAFPSTYETQGIVALEAMAAGLPVVGANAKAIPEFVKDGENGYLFSPFNAIELAEKILIALENKEVVENAKKFVKEYSIEKMANKLIELYEKANENKR